MCNQNNALFGAQNNPQPKPQYARFDCLKFIEKSLKYWGFQLLMSIPFFIVSSIFIGHLLMSNSQSIMNDTRVILAACVGGILSIKFLGLLFWSWSETCPYTHINDSIDIDAGDECLRKIRHLNKCIWIISWVWPVFPPIAMFAFKCKMVMFKEYVKIQYMLSKNGISPSLSANMFLKIDDKVENFKKWLSGCFFFKKSRV